MRSYLATTVCALLFLFTGAASAEDARAFLDRAIQAHGGAARLERTKKGHLKGKCDLTKLDASSTYEFEEWFDLPTRYKQIADFRDNNAPLRREIAYTGKEGWSREGSKAVRNERRKSFHVEEHWYAFLAVLLSLREKDVRLTLLPEETKDGRTLAGIQAVNTQVLEDFFFDKSTGLLQRKKLTPLSQEASFETLYDDYRGIQGVQYPMRFRVTAKEYSSTVTLSSIEFLDKIDDSIFAKPETLAAEGTVEETVVRKTSSPPTTESSEKTPEQRNRVLIVVTVIAGVIVGTVWFIVRVSKHGKQGTPPS